MGTRGSRPSTPRDQRYITGAVCPAREIGAALVLPEVNVEAMNLHLAEISRNVATGTHIVLDGAGWHQPAIDCACLQMSAYCICWKVFFDRLSGSARQPEGWRWKGILPGISVWFASDRTC